MQKNQPGDDCSIPRFDREFFASGRPFSRIGGGELGGKAKGLVFVRDTLRAGFEHARFPGSEVRIPATVVIATDVFEAFLERNRLHEIALSEGPDHHIAQAFQRASLPVEIVGDLQGLVDQVHTPLAVRSSSLLEDALDRPFAGVYETKMTPNNQASRDERFHKLVEAVKFVYASTFFRSPKAYARATGRSVEEERMAVIIEEVVGSRRWDRFYPTLSAVGRTYNYYAAGNARPEEGVMSLALGLGKTIVDGGACWTYSPAFPAAPAPYGSNRDLLRYSQSRFWAVNMGRPPAFDPTVEQEFLAQGGLDDAEADGTLACLASTYDGASDRLLPGISRPGPRIIDFAPLLKNPESEFNEVIRLLLATCREATGTDVEVEMAIDMGRERERTLFGFLQVRPMRVSDQDVEIAEDELHPPDLLLASDRVVGNGVEEKIRDVVYLKPHRFEPGATPAIASQVATMNSGLVKEGVPYLLIGFGRWGTSDPWGGIPVVWDQIGGARVIVEASLASFRAEPSQGSHFFHNVISLKVLYFSLSERDRKDVDWTWLEEQPHVSETEFVRHVRLERPLLVKVDGKSRRGAIWKVPSGESGRGAEDETPSTGAHSV